jgi:hypothetical protein
LTARSSRSMKDEHGIGDASTRIARRLAERRVMHTQLGKCLAGLEMKIAQDVIRFLRCQLVRRLRGGLGLPHGSADDN